MLALGKGAQEQVKKNIASTWLKPSFGEGVSPFREGFRSRRVRSPFYVAGRGRDQGKDIGIERVVPYVNGRAQVIYGGKNWNTPDTGNDIRLSAARNTSAQSGRFFDDEETITRQRVAIIGKNRAGSTFRRKESDRRSYKDKQDRFPGHRRSAGKGASGFQNRRMTG